MAQQLSGGLGGRRNRLEGCSHGSGLRSIEPEVELKTFKSLTPVSHICQCSPTSQVSRTCPNSATSCRRCIQSMNPWETFQIQMIKAIDLEETAYNTSAFRWCQETALFAAQITMVLTGRTLYTCTLYFIYRGHKIDISFPGNKAFCFALEFIFNCCWKPLSHNNVHSPLMLSLQLGRLPGIWLPDTKSIWCMTKIKPCIAWK